MIRPRFSVAGLMGLVLAVSLAFVSLRFASDAWAGAIVLLTLGVLCLAILGLVLRRGTARAAWLGFALFGWGYMALASQAWWDRYANRPELLTTRLLDDLYLYLRPDQRTEASFLLWPRFRSEKVDARDAMILRKLEEPVAMSFGNETPLEDVLKYVKSATTGPKDNGIPMYVDPLGLEKAGKTMTSPVMVDLEGVPLRTTLRLLLRQLGLTYQVRDGLLSITAATDIAESFRRIGHCYWALLFAYLGSLAGRALHGTREVAPGRPEDRQG